MHPNTPDTSDLGAVRSFVSSRTGRPTAVDLFCGAGGLSLGLERAGFDVLVGADSDPWAVRTHDANLPGLSWCGDLTDPGEFLTTLGVWGVDKVDLVAGGVPCQPFSRAGSSRIRDLVETGERAPHDLRADLWSSFVSVVEALSPAAVVVENVPDLARWNDGAVLMALHESLEDLGYNVEARIIDGFRYGVPQHRSRLILIGIDGNRTPVWPQPSDQYTSLHDAIADLPPIPRAQRSERLPYDPRRQTSDYQRRMRDDVKDADADLIYEHICRDVRPDDMEAFRLLGEGQTYIDLPERLQRYRSDVFTDKYKRLTWSELSRTITAHIAKDGYWYIHPDQHRTLSLREAARVQSFPDSFSFAGTQTHRYRQIGNAVPVILGEVVGQAVMEALKQPQQAKPADQDRFRDRLIAWRQGTDSWSAPWRLGLQDPWLVLAAELTLARMRPMDAEVAYAGLRRLVPSPGALLAYDEPARVLRGIGLTNERAARLLDVADDLVTYFDGAVPTDEAILLLLPGVGEYTGRAVLTFALGRRQVLLDHATARVAGRLTRHGDTRRFQLRLDLHRLAGSIGPDAEFNRAILDLARDLCQPKDPKCELCPLKNECATGGARAGQLELLGVREESEDRLVVAA